MQALKEGQTRRRPAALALELGLYLVLRFPVVGRLIVAVALLHRALARPDALNSTVGKISLYRALGRQLFHVRAGYAGLQTNRS